MTNYSIHKLQPANAHLTEQLRAYAYDVIGCEESRVPENLQFLGRGGSATITFVAAQLNHGSPLPTKYMYQEALAIALNEANIPFQREYYFSVEFHGQRIEHKHFVDFLVRNDKKSGLPKISNFWEEEEARPLHLLQRNLIMDRRFRREQRQQLWNYMRLTSTRIGILYNFAPLKDECERYYLDATTGMMYAF